MSAIDRHRIWNFHNPRLSIAQSGMRAVISHSLTGPGGAALMQSRIAAWSSGAIGIHAQPIPSVGVCAAEPAMKAVGTILDQIDQGQITNAADACAAYRAARSAGPLPSPPDAIAQPPAHAVEPAALGAGTVSAGLGSDCLDLVAQFLLAWVFDDRWRENQIASEFKGSSCDPGWLIALKAWLVFYWSGKPPVYNPPTAATVPIALPPAAPGGSLRVGILGDWGTGEPEAIAVLDQLMQWKPDLIIHLGDIYYAGTIDECRTNFLMPIQAARRKFASNIPVYTIPGNHDYYSGGNGFYAIIPLLNQGVPFGAIQNHSFFCLQNDDWHLECMDTGYNDHNLKLVADDITELRPDEAAWHKEQLKAAASRKIILMSHHQLFSAFATIGPSHASYQNPYLTRNLEDWRAAGVSNILAWLWGHEHLLEVYAAPAADGTGLPVLGRCVGHAAFPVFNNKGAYTRQPASPIPLQSAADFPSGYVQTSDDGLVYASGFAMLTLAAGVGKADYYQVIFDGDVSRASSQLLWSDTFSSGAKPVVSQ
jgi:predicted phosphodiesterase